MSMYAQSLRHYLKPVIEYIDDPEVTEIMINGPDDIWIERNGRVTKVKAKFTPEGLEAAARNMAQYVDRPLDDERPRLDARLPDGSRIHVVMPPIARKGCTIAIRKFFRDRFEVDRLVEFGSLTESMAKFIDACVSTKQNIIVSGGTGSGKTTLLNCLAQYIPNDERILTIEDSSELQLNQEHLVPFESRPADKFGKGRVDMGDLLQSALRLRPDRIVVGEVRGGEAFHLMQAMNTGHGGSLSTVHANTPTDTLRRLEALCLQSGIDIPLVAVRAQVASAINIVVCCSRLQDGQRKITEISEVLPLDEKGNYRAQDIFVFTTTHKDSKGRIHGYHSPTGLLPTFLDRLNSHGFEDLNELFFDPDTYGVEPPPVFKVSENYQARWVPSLSFREGPEEESQRKRPLHKGAAKEKDNRLPVASRIGRPRPSVPDSALGVTSFDGDDEDESTDPSLVGPAPDVTQCEDRLSSVKHLENVNAHQSDDNVPMLEDDDLIEEVESDEEAEMRAIEELLKKEALALHASKDPSTGTLKPEPSIQLSEDLIAEAKKFKTPEISPEYRPRKSTSRPATDSTPKPVGRARVSSSGRRKGGVIGRSGDPD